MLYYNHRKGRKTLQTGKGKTMKAQKRYWMNKETEMTAVTWGQNVRDPKEWDEITKEEYDRRADELIKLWAEAMGYATKA